MAEKANFKQNSMSYIDSILDDRQSIFADWSHAEQRHVGLTTSNLKKRVQDGRYRAYENAMRTGYHTPPAPTFIASMTSSNDLNTVIMEALSRKPQRKQIAKAFDEVHRLNRDYLDRKRDAHGHVGKPYMPSYDKTTIKRRDDGTLSLRMSFDVVCRDITGYGIKSTADYDERSGTVRSYTDEPYLTHVFRIAFESTDDMHDDRPFCVLTAYPIVADSSVHPDLTLWPHKLMQSLIETVPKTGPIENIEACANPATWISLWAQDDKKQQTAAKKGEPVRKPIYQLLSLETCRDNIVQLFERARSLSQDSTGTAGGDEPRARPKPNECDSPNID